MSDAASKASLPIDAETMKRPAARGVFTSAKILRFIHLLSQTFELLKNLRRFLHAYYAISGIEYAEIRKLQPQIIYKWVNRHYLVLGLTSSTRGQAYENHYRFMKNQFSRHYLKNHLVSGVSLWKQDGPDGLHELLLSFSHPCDNEGELTVFYNFSGISLARGSFTFVPAELVGEKSQNSILITRLQGEKNVYEHVRNARRSLHGLDGPALIVACLAGIAQTLRFNSLTIVSAEVQVSRNDQNAGTLLAAYDGFFLSIGAEAVLDKFLRVSLPLPEKALSEVKSSNRKKVASQRLIKEQIGTQTIAQFDKHVLCLHNDG